MKSLKFEDQGNTDIHLIRKLDEELPLTYGTYVVWGMRNL